MPKSVHITTPPLSETERKEQLKRLRIPRKRQKELQALLDLARVRFSGARELSVAADDLEESRKSAPAA